LREKNPTKLALIGKYEGLFRLAQDQVIILPVLVFRSFHPKLAGHTQMESQPNFTAFSESEYHLLAQSLRVEKLLSGYGPDKPLRIHASKDTRFSVAQSDFQNFCTFSHLPETPAPLDFGQFGHFTNLSRSTRKLPNSYVDLLPLKIG
jgi:hypothetical protein